MLISPVSGVFSAAGMLAAEAEHSFVRAILAPLDGVPEAVLDSARTALAADGEHALAAEGYGGDAATLRFAADLRYLGQSSELTVPVTECLDAGGRQRLAAAFHRLYAETFGYSADEPVELVNLRVTAVGTAATRIDFAALDLDPAALAGGSGSRMVSFARDGAPVATRIVPRAAVADGPVAGPAIIESYDTTIVVPPGCTARAAEAGCIAIDLEPA